MPDQITRFSVLATAGLLLLGQAAPVEAARAAPGTWGPVQRLSAAGVQAHHPEVVVDSAGVATVAWETGRDVQVRRLPAGGAPSAVRTLGTGTNPSLGVADSTAVTVAWQGVRGSIKVVTRSAAGTWGAVRTLSPPYRRGTHVGLAKGGLDPRVVVNPAGDTVVVWQYGLLNDMPDSGGRLQAAYRAHGQGWSIDNLTSYALGGSDHEVAMSDDGSVDVAFETAGIYAIHRTPGVGWSPAVRLQRRGYNPTVAVDPLGNATAGWTRRSDSRLLVAERPAGGGWGTPTEFPATSSGYDFALVMDQDSRVLASWISVGLQDLLVSGRPFGAPFWTPATVVAHVSGDSTYLDLLRLTTNRRGDVVASWVGSTDTGSWVEFAAYGATRPWNSATWTVPTRLTSAYPARVEHQAAAVDPTGATMAVWDRGQPSPSRVEGRRWTP